MKKYRCKKCGKDISNKDFELEFDFDNKKTTENTTDIEYFGIHKNCGGLIEKKDKK
jgi:hypothetical protein